MYQKERLDGILEEVKRYGYVTVKHLVSAFHYSNATINRDLNILEGQKLVRRTYGGVEFVSHEEIPLPFRYHKMKTEKLKLSKKAADLINDGDTVFIDAATTTENIARFLTDKKDVTVITNNVAVVTMLSEYNVTVICLGGKVVEPPCMLDGEETVENAMRYHVDKMFFATSYLSHDGWISSNYKAYYLLHRAMANNSKEVYYLVDHEKFTDVAPVKKNLFSLERVTAVIADFEFDEKLKKKFPNTKFITV